ncbi:MAG: lipoate--protein ligase family protein [Rubripirellula sp.]
MMQRMFDHFVDPADHLALDEAILMRSESSGPSHDVLRVWEFTHPVVIAGRSTRVDFEVNTDYCRDQGIPVLRRCSGGASVVGGPGCLMYSVVLSHQGREELKRIDAAHAFVMGRVLKAVRQQVDQAELQGICDLTYKDRKCSGNSLRVTRGRLLYHGTLLYDFDLSLLASCLLEAPRQPTYRQGRGHGAFVTNVPIDPTAFATDFAQAFGVEGTADANSLQTQIRELREQRYDSQAWHFRH